MYQNVFETKDLKHLIAHLTVMSINLSPHRQPGLWIWSAASLHQDSLVPAAFHGKTDSVRQDYGTRGLS